MSRSHRPETRARRLYESTRVYFERGGWAITEPNAKYTALRADKKKVREFAHFERVTMVIELFAGVPLYEADRELTAAEFVRSYRSWLKRSARQSEKPTLRGRLETFKRLRALVAVEVEDSGDVPF